MLPFGVPADLTDLWGYRGMVFTDILEAFLNGRIGDRVEAPRRGYNGTIHLVGPKMAGYSALGIRTDSGQNLLVFPLKFLKDRAREEENSEIPVCGFPDPLAHLPRCPTKPFWGILAGSAGVAGKDRGPRKGRSGQVGKQVIL